MSSSCNRCVTVVEKQVASRIYIEGGGGGGGEGGGGGKERGGGAGNGS